MRVGRPLRRRSALAAALLACSAACGERARPSPLDPGVGMSVEVTSPDDGDSVRPGPLDVTVHGHDGVGRMDALGVVVLTAPAPGLFVDSVVVHFTARVDTTVTVRVTIPRVSKPTGFELRGLALNVTGGVVRTGARALIVIP